MIEYLLFYLNLACAKIDNTAFSHFRSIIKQHILQAINVEKNMPH